jgi:hypothetical protein
MVSPIVFQTMCTDSNSVSCIVIHIANHAKIWVSILIGRELSCHESRCWFESGLTRNERYVYYYVYNYIYLKISL